MLVADLSCPVLTAQDSLFYAIFTDEPRAGPDAPKTDPADYQFAGFIGMISSDYQAMKCEPGYIMILSPFHVSCSCCLLLFLCNS